MCAHSILLLIVKTNCSHLELKYVSEALVDLGPFSVEVRVEGGGEEESHKLGGLKEKLYLWATKGYRREDAGLGKKEPLHSRPGEPPQQLTTPSTPTRNGH